MTTIEQLTGIFQDVFDTDELVLERAHTAADIRGWDSVMNVRIMLEIESSFGVRFTAGEVTNLRSVGQLVDAIDARR